MMRHPGPCKNPKDGEKRRKTTKDGERQRKTARKKAKDVIGLVVENTAIQVCN